MDEYSGHVSVELAGTLAGQEDMATCVFVVEDNADLNRDLCEYLEICGFDVIGCDTGAAFYRALERKKPDAVILDIMLPDTDGYELAKYCRGNLQCGIMMLTSLSAMDHHLAGYQAGADVYLTKDSPLSVIEAALRPLLRRIGKGDGDAAAASDGMSNDPAGLSGHDMAAAIAGETGWVLDMLNWTLSGPQGHSASLTATERTIIGLLIGANGAWLTRPEIVAALGKADTAENCRNLDTAIRRVRQKVLREVAEELPIRTAYGRGYAFTSPGQIIASADAAQPAQ